MIRHYLRMATANLRRHGPTTAINIVGLTLGVGCFLMAYAMARHSQTAEEHFANFERIHFVQQRNVAPGEDGSAPFMSSASLSLAEHLRAEFPELAAVARKAAGDIQINAADRELGARAEFADPDVLRVFDYPFVAGDPVHALAAPNAAVIVDRVAEGLFGTRDAVGRVFTIDRRLDVIVRGVVEEPRGLTTVMSSNFDVLLNMTARDALLRSDDVDAPADPPGDTWANADPNALTYLLLPEDKSLSVDQLDRGLARIAQRVIPSTDEQVSFRVRHLSTFFDDRVTGLFSTLGIAPGVRFATLLFLPGLVLLAMACFNYTNLSVAVASTRARQVGLRKVLGAGSRQVVQQHLFEALLTVLAAVALAVPLAALGLNVINNLEPVFEIPLLRLADAPAVAVLGSIVLATSAAAGGYPAMVMARFRPIEALRIGSMRAGSGVLRNVFIGVQFAVAGTLLTAVLVMFAQNGALSDNAYRLGSDPYVQIFGFLDEAGVDPDVFRSALMAAPQIKSVTGTRRAPFDADLDSDFYSAASAGARPAVRVQSRFVGYDFFPTLGTEMIAGRPFDRDRDRPYAARAAASESSQAGRLGAVVDRAAALALGFAAPGDAIGQIVYQRGISAGGSTTVNELAFEIIGVVDQAPLQLYFTGTKANIYHIDPYRARPLIRIAADDVPGALAHIDSVWEQLAPETPIVRAFLDDLLRASVVGLNGLTSAFLTIVVFGFLVALAGIYGMALFVASQRRHEIGIRKSLGANSRRILRELLAEFGKPVVAGSIAAWPIGYLLSQEYLDLFTERMSFTVWPYVLGLVITLGIAWLGIGGRALAAARLRPAQVLRYE